MTKFPSGISLCLRFHPAEDERTDREKDVSIRHQPVSAIPLPMQVMATKEVWGFHQASACVCDSTGLPRVTRGDLEAVLFPSGISLCLRFHAAVEP